MASWEILVLSFALFAGNVSASKRPRILNGKDANIEDFPYQASLRHNKKHLCGGSIISERHILTAAHCIDSHIIPPYEWQSVVTGSSYKSKGGNVHKIAKINVHPRFSVEEKRGLNDVAVITLKDKIVFDKYQQKINLPEHNFEVGQKVNLTGWGRTRQIPAIRPDRLQKLEMELISNEECQQKVMNPEKIKIYNTEFCTKTVKGTGICIGDSGGPLAANGELVGVIAWTDGDYCGDGYPDVYVNVYKFKNFIKSVMSNTV